MKLGIDIIKVDERNMKYKYVFYISAFEQLIVKGKAMKFWQFWRKVNQKWMELGYSTECLISQQIVKWTHFIHEASRLTC